MTGNSSTAQMFSGCASVMLKQQPTLWSRLRNLFNQAQSGFRQLFETPEATLDPQKVDANDQAWQAFNLACEQQWPIYRGDMTLCCWLNMTSIFTPDSFDNFAQTLLNIHQLLLKGLDLLDKLPSEPDENAIESTTELFEHYQLTLVQWAGENPNSGQLTRFLSYLPLTTEKRFYHFVHANQYGHLEQLQAHIDEALKAQPTLLQQRLAQLSVPIEILGTIAHALEQLGEHPNMPRGDDDKPLLSVIDTSYISGVLNNMTAAVCELSHGQLSPFEAKDSAQATSGQHIDAVEPQLIKPCQIPPMPQLNPNTMSREMAFEHLKQLAAFFNRTEPHSPVSYQIERAIRWGQCSLPEIMSELLGDNQEACNRVEQLVGLKDLYPADD